MKKIPYLWYILEHLFLCTCSLICLFFLNLVNRYETQNYISTYNTPQWYIGFAVQKSVSHSEVLSLKTVEIIQGRGSLCAISEWVKYLEIYIIYIKVIPWIIGTAGEYTCHLRNRSEGWKVQQDRMIMFLFLCITESKDARWYMPRHALSSARGWLFPVVHCSILNDSNYRSAWIITSVLYTTHSSKVCTGSKSPTTPTGRVSPHNTDI